MRRALFCLVCMLALMVVVVHSQPQSLLPVLQVMGKPDVSLAGSPQSRLWQNQRADWASLGRIENEKERLAMIKSGELVAVIPTGSIRIDPRLEKRKRFLRPFALEKLKQIADEFKERTGLALTVNSASRTVAEQNSLARLVAVRVKGRTIKVPRNGNAAPVDGPDSSAHIRGATVDLARKKLTPEQDLLLGMILMRLELDDCLEATREIYQAVFHVTFFPSCGAELVTQRATAQ